jgi:hypothetical protein
MKLHCKLFGHHWFLKGYKNTVDVDGRKIPFTAKRICSRCEKSEYKYAEWIDENLVPEAHRKMEGF